MSETVRRVARNTVWLAAGEGAVKGALFLAAVIVARSAGPGGMGVFSIAYAAALLAVMVLAAGQQEVVIREVAATPPRAGRVLDAALRVQAGFGRWVLPLLIVGALFLTDPDLRRTCLAFVPYAWLRTRLVTCGAAFKGLDRMDMEVRARAFEVVIVLPGLAAVGWAGLPVWTTGLVFAAGAGAGLLWLAARSRSLERAEDAGAVGPAEQTGPLWRAFRREGLPFLALAVLSQLLARADNFLLAAYGVPSREIGYYGAAGAPVWGLVAIPTLLAVAFYPTLSRRAAAGESPLRPVLASVVAGGVLGACLAAALTLARGPLIAIAFGSDYTASAALLGRLAWVLPTRFVMTLIGLILAAWHRQHLAVVGLMAVLAVSIVLNLLWIPIHGPLGSASAAVTAHAVGVALLLALAVRVKPMRGGGDGA